MRFSILLADHCEDNTSNLFSGRFHYWLDKLNFLSKHITIIYCIQRLGFHSNTFCSFPLNQESISFNSTVELHWEIFFYPILWKGLHPSGHGVRVGLFYLKNSSLSNWISLKIFPSGSQRNSGRLVWWCHAAFRMMGWIRALARRWQLIL